MEPQPFKSKCTMILIALNASLPSIYIGYTIVYFASLPFATIQTLFSITIPADTAKGILNGCIQAGAFIGALGSSLLFRLFSRK